MRRLTFYVSVFLLAATLGLATYGTWSAFHRRAALQPEPPPPATLPSAAPISTINLEPKALPMIPDAIRAALDKRFPGWTFMDVSDEIRQALKTYGVSDHDPACIQGDFDGNGQADYALLITHREVNAVAETGQVAIAKTALVAFLQKAGRYKFYLVNPEGGGDYIALGKKGEQAYDYETGRYFHFSNDVIHGCIFERAGSSYIYERGSFKSVLTSD